MHFSLKLHLNFTKGINFHITNHRRQILNHVSVSRFTECVNKGSGRKLYIHKILSYLWSLQVHGNCSLELATGLFSDKPTQPFQITFI
jgi:hypothetical protein